MSLRSEPLVSAVIPAFNAAEFLREALDSAFDQEGFAGQVEAIVVDDGSTDDTAAVLAVAKEFYGDRLHVIHQENAGVNAAVDRGLADVRGDYVALLDADDVWRPDRLKRHLAILEARPAVGLTYGDGEMIDAAGHVTHRSWHERELLTPKSGRVLADVMRPNFVVTSGVTFRASLLAAVRPILDASLYQDWWVAATIAAVAELEQVPGVSFGYREHDNNAAAGVNGGARLAKRLRGEIRYQRWLIENLLDDPSLGPQGIWNAADGLFTSMRVYCEIGGSLDDEGVTPVDTERATAAREAVPAKGTGLRTRPLLRAWAQDPFDGSLWIEFLAALRRESVLAQAPPPPLIATVAMRGRVTVAWLSELVRRPALLRAYAEDVSGTAEAALVIVSDDPAAEAALIELVSADPLLSSDDLELVLIAEPVTTPARRFLAARATSLLTLVPRAAEYAALPPHPMVEELHVA